MKKYYFQFTLFTLFLIIQTLLLRFIYFQFGRNIYKPIAYALITIFIITTIFLSRKNKWNKKDLGIRFDNFIEGMPVYSLITAVLILGIFLLKNSLGRSIRPDIASSWHFKGLFVISSIGQEFLFRSYLMKLQITISKNKILAILANGLLFGFMHIMVVPEPIPISFLLTFIMGISLAYAYLKTPNLFLASISHAILNYLVAFFCFFSFKC